MFVCLITDCCLLTINVCLLIAPVCENLALGKHATYYHSGMVPKDRSESYAMRAVDGYKFYKCVYLVLHINQKAWWAVDLVEEHYIHIVNIYHDMVRKYLFLRLSQKQRQKCFVLKVFIPV